MSTSIYNQQTLRTLDAATSQGRIWASLIIEEDAQIQSGPQRIIPFLINPEELQFSAQANFVKTSTAGTSVQSRQFYNTEGVTLKIPNILFETYRDGVSVERYLNQFRSLLQPTIDAEKWYAPNPLLFVWGSRQFGPCILTSVDWNENAWLGGQPATGRLSLTLEEIPPSDTELARRLIPSREPSENALDAPLTERQRAEGSEQAQAWLRENVGELEPLLQERVRSDRYLLTTDEATGLTTITDENGEAIGTVGRWDGRVFVVEDVQEL